MAMCQSNLICEHSESTLYIFGVSKYYSFLLVKAHPSKYVGDITVCITV